MVRSLHERMYKHAIQHCGQSAILSHVLSGTAQPSGFTAEWTTLFRTETGGYKPQADCPTDSLTKIEVCLKTCTLFKKKEKKRGNDTEWKKRERVIEQIDRSTLPAHSHWLYDFYH